MHKRIPDGGMASSGDALERSGSGLQICSGGLGVAQWGLGFTCVDSSRLASTPRRGHSHDVGSVGSMFDGPPTLSRLVSTRLDLASCPLPPHLSRVLPLSIQVSRGNSGEVGWDGTKRECNQQGMNESTDEMGR